MLVNITIPVFNEEVQLPASVSELNRLLDVWACHDYEIVIANNGSTDRTSEVAHDLAKRYPRLRVVDLSEKGRGRALKKTWLESEADLLTYMDVDLSSDVNAFPSLIQPLVSGESDLATGSRLLRPELTSRGWKREFISRSYNLLVRTVFRTSFSDAQCGFKAITRSAARALIPLVEDNHWFMDTELLVLAQRLGYGIFDLPIRWVDDPDSRVKLFKTAIDDLKGIVRLRRSLASQSYVAHAKSRQAVAP